MVSETIGKPTRVAVVLYGPVRTFQQTATSFMRHVAEPHDATVFYYGPEVTDEPGPDHKGSMIAEQFHSPKSELASDIAFNEKQLKDVYAPRLAQAVFHNRPASEFVAEASVCSRDDWLYGIHPYRILAMCYNISHGARLIWEYERDNHVRFDAIIFTRTDIAFYSPLSIAALRSGTLLIPQGEGFTEDGERNTENAPVFYYKNKSTGDYIPGGLSVRFNDQIMAVGREGLDRFFTLHDDAMHALADGAPANAETLLYLLLAKRGGLQVRPQQRWIFEICRFGEKVVANVFDTPRFALHDPNHPKARSMLKRNAGIRSRLPRMERTAVLLYGLLREYKAVAPSLLRHVVDLNNGAILYFGPRYSDAPTKAHTGRFDAAGFFIHNPKGNLEELVSADIDSLHDTYGPALVMTDFHDLSQHYFSAVSDSLVNKDDWLFMLNPYRMLSMFYNMQGVARLLLEFERQSGETFDNVILTRPDLAFFSPIRLALDLDEVQIPAGEGFDVNGRRHIGNASTFFFKDVAEGRYVPAGREITFNDQIMAIKREKLHLFTDIYDRALHALAHRAPGSPETILYMLVAQEAALRVTVKPEWIYEIYRKGEPLSRSVIDTPDLATIDPHHAKAFQVGHAVARVAVCVLGEFPNWRENRRTLANFLAGADCDIYVYCQNEGARDAIARDLKPSGLIVESADSALLHIQGALRSCPTSVSLEVRARERVLKLMAVSGNRYGRVVMIQSDLAVQQSLVELLEWVAHAGNLKNRVFVPACLQRSGINADLMIMDVGAVDGLGRVSDSYSLADASSRELLLLRQLWEANLAISVLPVTYIRTLHSAVVFAAASDELSRQERHPQLRNIPGPPIIRSATPYFYDKYRAMELALKTGTTQGFALVMQPVMFHPASQGYLRRRPATVNFFREEGGPFVRAATSVKRPFGSVRRYAKPTPLGFALVLEETEFDLLVVPHGESTIEVIYYCGGNLEKPEFSCVVDVGQSAIKVRDEFAPQDGLQLIGRDPA